MRLSHEISAVAGVILLLLISGCRKVGQQPNLRDRIVAANTAQYCYPPDACFNPNVLAVEDGYVVTIFLGATAQHATIKPKELANYLQALPMQAWPRGPSIVISPTDFVRDGHAVQENFNAAQQVCRSLGLEVDVRLGG